MFCLQDRIRARQVKLTSNASLNYKNSSGGSKNGKMHLEQDDLDLDDPLGMIYILK